MIELKNKLIIRNYTEFDDIDVLERFVVPVIKNGKISETEKFGKQYCFISTFETESGDIYVSVDKKSLESSTFYVYRRSQR